MCYFGITQKVFIIIIIFFFKIPSKPLRKSTNTNRPTSRQHPHLSKNGRNNVKNTQVYKSFCVPGETRSMKNQAGIALLNEKNHIAILEIYDDTNNQDENAGNIIVLTEVNYFISLFSMIIIQSHITSLF